MVAVGTFPLDDGWADIDPTVIGGICELSLCLHQCATLVLDELNRLLPNWCTRRKVRLLNDVLLLTVHSHIAVWFDLVRTAGTTVRLHRLHLQLLRWSLEADRVALCVRGDVDWFLFDDRSPTATSSGDHSRSTTRHYRRCTGRDDRGTSRNRWACVAYDHLPR
uniref:Uncharacterized protein n=1 Tax=Anopheles culicifacies TaxID=139723 RepID=A0A182MAZ8_9DIPT